MFDLPIPEEPADRSVVLDQAATAWQRRDDLAPEDAPERRWFAVGAVVATIFGPSKSHARPWRHLLVDRGPLAPMLAESALEAEGWTRDTTPPACASRARTPITAGEVRGTGVAPHLREEVVRGYV